MKIRILFLAVGGAIAAGGASLPPGEQAQEDCCAVPVVEVAADDCCAVPVAAATGPLSRDSLYQTEVGFTNDRGEAFSLAELRGRPVVLTMFFTSCSHACPMLVTAMQELRAALPSKLANPPVFVLISFDVERDTPAVLAQHRQSRLLDAQWELLHGNNDAVRELAALLGIKYQQDAGGGFSHSNIISILNPEGEVIHQRIGLMGGMEEAEAALMGVTGSKS